MGGVYKTDVENLQKRGKGAPGGMQMERNLGEVGAAGIKPFYPIPKFLTTIDTKLN